MNQYILVIYNDRRSEYYNRIVSRKLLRLKKKLMNLKRNNYGILNKR